jgi:hypothetical protein
METDMRDRIRRPSHATIVAYLALFAALGGTGYAAITLPKNSVGAKQIRTGAVTSKEIRNNQIRSGDLRNNTLLGRDIRANALGGREINETTLGPVPNALTLSGLTPDQLKVRCPADTVKSADTCIETNPRSAESYGQANDTCTLIGRRLSTFAELTNFYSFERPVAPGGELAADVSESSTTAGQLVAVVILTNSGSSVEFVPATGATQRAFRCAVTPSN